MIEGIFLGYATSVVSVIVSIMISVFLLRNTIIKEWFKIFLFFVFIVLGMGSIIAMSQAAAKEYIGTPASFSLLKNGTVYETVAEAGKERLFWIKSREGESRIFKDVPLELRKEGIKFVILDDGIITIVKEGFTPDSSADSEQ